MQDDTQTECTGYHLYLAHPFDSRHKIRKWELELEQKYSINICNPFYDIDRKDIDAIDAGTAKRYAVSPTEVVERDLHALAAIPAVIAIVDGSTSYGTPMEIVYAYNEGKKIYIICTNGHHEHPWLRYHADEIFTSFTGFEAKLKRALTEREDLFLYSKVSEVEAKKDTNADA